MKKAENLWSTAIKEYMYRKLKLPKSWSDTLHAHKHRYQRVIMGKAILIKCYCLGEERWSSRYLLVGRTSYRGTI